MRVDKSKLPKGMSWPMKTSLMSEALQSAKIVLDVQLNYVVSRRFFDAEFWPPNPNVQYERLYITVSAIPAEQARKVREFVEGTVIPDFITWVQGIVSLPTNSPVRREKQHFHYELPPLAPGD
jgi:hypothetical protein